MSLAESIHHTLSQLIPAESKLVVAISGGADSLTLLHLLRDLTHSQAYPLQLHAATLDHGLRGEASAADAQFVVQTCEAWGIPVTAGMLDADILPRDTGVEHAARVARYDFLAHVARQVGAQYVAVAHHADDQAETVLMHLLRGSGLQGLAGMRAAAPLPGHPDLTLIRPLLAVPRHEIEAYCQEHGLKPRHDHTNDDLHLLRNRIRLETLPHLREINPQIDRALARLAAAAALDQAYIREQLASEIDGHFTQNGQQITLHGETFRSLPLALRHHFILWAAGQLGGEDITSEQVTRLATLALKGHTGQQMPLPGGLRLRLDYDVVVIEHAGAQSDPDLPLLTTGAILRLTVPGATPLPASGWQLETQNTPFNADDEPYAQLAVHPDQSLELRTRRSGDRFAPLGMNGHTQTIKQWMIDHKIPRTLRDQLPLLTVGDDIAALLAVDRWIIGEKFAVREAERPVIYIRFTKFRHSERLS